MGISAASSAAQIMSTIRNQYRDQFAKLKEAYQESGSIVGASASYTSDDGNVKISVQGMQTAEGRQFVDVKFSADGQEAASLQRELSGGLDASTGLPVSADTRYGSIGLDGSDFVATADDLDALADKFAGITLKTQAQQDAETPSWSVGDQTFTSVEAYHAYMRVENAAFDAANAMAAKMKFSSGEDEVDFVIKTQKALAAALRGGGNVDLTAMLGGVPADAIKNAMKALDKKNADAERLIGFLTDYLDASKRKSAEQQRTDLLV